MCQADQRSSRAPTERQSSLVARAATPVGKVPPLKVGTKEGDQIVGQSPEISDDGHRFPAARMRVEAQTESPGAERRGSGDGGAVLDEDRQVSPDRPDLHVSVVAEGVDRLPQYLGVVRSRLSSRLSLVCRPEGSSQRPRPLDGGAS
jgi:hypothetical protein